MDESNKPKFVPPTLGDELGRHGMAYDFGATEEGPSLRGQQKSGRGRNKNNRRNNKGSNKEVNMEETSSTPNGSRNNPGHQNLNPEMKAFVEVLERGQTRLHDGIKETLNDGNNTIAKTLGEKLGEINHSLITFNEKTDAMVEVVEGARVAALGAKAAVIAVPEETAKKLNKFFDKDNLLRDVRSALVHISVASVVGGIAWGVAFLLGDSDVPEAGAPMMNGANTTASRRSVNS